MSFKEDCSIFTERKTRSAIKKEEVEKTWGGIKTWYAQKNDYITKGQFEKLEKEIQDLTLHPKINKTSKKIMEKVLKFLNKLFFDKSPYLIMNFLFFRKISMKSLSKIV